MNSAFSYCKLLKKAILPEALRQNPSRIFCEHRIDDDYDSYDGFCTSLDTVYIENELIVPTTKYRNFILECLYGTGVHDKFRDVLETYLIEQKCPYCGGPVRKHFLSTYYCERCSKDFGSILTSAYHTGFPYNRGREHYKKVINSKWYKLLKQSGEV